MQNMSDTDRRRNQFAGVCRVCGCSVDAWAGWLYSDTRARSSHRTTGRWPKFVKCERCHALKAARKSDLPENRVAGPATIPVTAVRRATVRPSTRTTDRRGGYTYPVVEMVLADGTTEVICTADAITGNPTASPAYYLSGACFGGRLLTANAEKAVMQIAEAAVETYRAHLQGS